jgi:5-(carboxyamino)imidazole ribonucleotide synthase
MTAASALQLGCNVVLLERDAQSPAATLATHSLVGDWRSVEELRKLAALSDVVTLENEFLDANLLAQLEVEGAVVRPGSRALGLVQDKLIQKQTVAAAGVRVPKFRAVGSMAELAQAGSDLGWPLVLKARRNGYDGKGNATLRSAGDIEGAWSRLNGGSNPLFVEEFCPFVAELAVIMVRGISGEEAAYPLVRSVQRDHICHEVHAPAPVPPEVRERALTLARKAVAAVEGVGSYGVEMFLLEDGGVVMNELAPRVHNTGHYTIEASLCSQFENHVRAVLGWPLGSTQMVAPAAAMINLLGQGSGPGVPHGLSEALRVPGAHVHVYGKGQSGAGRKMGHVTALGGSLEDALERARRAAGVIRFGDLA